MLPEKSEDTGLEKLLARASVYLIGSDIELLRRAYDFASRAHGSQKRISGDPYITHPVQVALILAEMELDPDTLAGALLHDVVEDTGVVLPEIEAAFGREIATLVDGVTKLGRLGYRSKEEQQVENLRKMFLAMAKDIRVILIKLADRLHNLRTLNYQPPQKQREVAEETLEVFAPLAHRLGIYHLKMEMEDLAFRYRQPEEYRSLADAIAKSRAKREEYIREVVKILREKLLEVSIRGDIQGRAKHLYSIYEKMAAQNKQLGEIYDVMAVRVLVHTVRDCYAVLGMVHSLWKPIPGRFKDYIAMPKSNMYQSLHTTVVGPQGDPVEIQIRTFDMHRTAEYGIAAHWRYKEGGNGETHLDQKLSWLRRLLEWQNDLRDAREFMESLKIDLFSDVVFVFTPRGDVIDLPAGSVPLDLAYRIHTDVGHRSVGAKVNGRIVPFDYRLTNGDIVEMITSKNGTPSRDWLKVVNTSHARTKIRQWFRKERREENIARGREALEREAKKLRLEWEAVKNERLVEIGRRYGLNSLEDVYAAVGDGTLGAAGLVAKIRDELLAERNVTPIAGFKPEAKTGADWSKPSQGIRVKGADNLLIRLAHCCNPVPGDPVVGFITRGRGISVHRADCRNLNSSLREESERFIEVVWDKDYKLPFQVRLDITGSDRAGLLGDVMAVLTEMKISANWVTARGTKERQAVIEMMLEMKSLDQLQYLVDKVTRVRGVHEVRRPSQGGAAVAGGHPAGT